MALPLGRREMGGVGSTQSRLKADDPELYAAYLSYVPKFESARLKADDPEKYAARQVVHRVRSFRLMTDIG